MAQIQFAAAVAPPPPRVRIFPAPAPVLAHSRPFEREPRVGRTLVDGVQANVPEIVQTILDCIQVGAMAVGPGCRVAFANRAAVRECNRYALMRFEDAQRAVLAPNQAADHERMAQAVDAAHAGQWSMVRLGAGAAALSIAVFPLCPRERSSGPLALLLFGLSGNHEPLAIQLYAKACGLTPAETRVLLGLSEGLLPKQIASKHEVLLSTVRTQLSSIRDKTGTRRLADLMRALVALPPIMPAAMGSA